MGTIRFKHTNDHYYYLIGADSKEECNLGIFLRTDFALDPSYFKEWILDPKDSVTSGNATVLMEDEDKIWIGDLYSPEENYEPYFIIDKDQLLALLDKWQKLCKEAHKEIIITIDGDNITMEGKD